MSDELSQAQLAHYASALCALHDELKQAITDARDFSQPVDLDSPIGRVSRIDAIAVQQMAKEGRRRLQHRLHQVEAAQARMQRDDYGFCLACDEPIPTARLDVRPETPTCVACQSLAERR